MPAAPLRKIVVREIGFEEKAVARQRGHRTFFTYKMKQPTTFVLECGHQRKYPDVHGTPKRMVRCKECQ